MNSDNKLPSSKQFNKLCQIAGKTIKNFSLVNPHDKVLIALSGGKDSQVLAEILAERKKHINFPFQLFAIHIKATGIDYKVDEEYLSSFCKALDIPLTIKTIKVDTSNTNKKECFICSWNRRKAIFETARELNCHKIAFGHHMDDAIETMFMNMIYHASISSLPPRLKLFEGEIELIRPLLEIAESDIITYEKTAGYKQNIKSCPHEDKTKRNAMKDLVKHMEPLNKNLRKNILRSTNKIFEEYLPGHKYETIQNENSTRTPMN